MKTILLTGDSTFFTACLVKNAAYKLHEYMKEVLDFDTHFIYDFMPESQYHPCIIENEIEHVMNQYEGKAFTKDSTVVIITFNDNVLNAARLITIENNNQNLEVYHVQHSLTNKILHKFEFSCITGNLIDSDSDGWFVMKQFSIIEHLLGKLAKFRRAKKE